MNNMIIHLFFVCSPDVRDFLSLDNPKNSQLQDVDMQPGADEGDSVVRRKQWEGSQPSCLQNFFENSLKLVTYSPYHFQVCFLWGVSVVHVLYKHIILVYPQARDADKIDLGESHDPK